MKVYIVKSVGICVISGVLFWSQFLSSAADIDGIRVFSRKTKSGVLRYTVPQDRFFAETNGWRQGSFPSSFRDLVVRAKHHGIVAEGVPTNGYVSAIRSGVAARRSRPEANHLHECMVLVIELMPPRLHDTEPSETWPKIVVMLPDGTIAKGEFE